VSDETLDEASSKMYTLEQVPAALMLTPEETSAVKQFNDNIQQD